jgi:hypothetical protein
MNQLRSPRRSAAEGGPPTFTEDEGPTALLLATSRGLGATQALVDKEDELPNDSVQWDHHGMLFKKRGGKMSKVTGWKARYFVLHQGQHAPPNDPEC